MQTEQSLLGIQSPIGNVIFTKIIATFSCSTPLIFPIDVGDTPLKGMAHFKAQGPLYLMAMVLWFILCIIAACTKRRLCHACFAVIFLSCNLVFVGTTLLTDQSVIGGALR
jgi:hypothetical protein